MREGVDAPGAGRAEQVDLRLRQLARVEHSGADGIVDVVVDVRDAIDEADDLPLVRVRLVRARVVEDPVANLGRQVEPAPVALEHLHHTQRVLVVPEVPAESLLQQRVERLLSGVSERRVPEVVTEADRLDEILVQPQRAGDPARDAGRLQRVGQARPEVVAGRIDEDLGLVHQPPERLRVDDPIAVALKRRAQQARLFLARAPARLERANGER